MPIKEGNSGFVTNVFIIALAVFASFFIMTASRPIVANRVMKRQAESALAASQRQPSIFYAGGTGETKPRIGFAAFGIPDQGPKKIEVGAAPEPTGNIRNFRLVGTLPSVGAWVDTGSEASLVLKGTVLDGYTLEQVEPDHVVFSREDEKYPIYMVYLSPGDAGGPVAQQPPVNVPGIAREPRIQSPAMNFDGIVQAKANGEDGTIAREMLNELLMNPLAEIGKMRLVPTENGMMIVDMRSDSLFNKLGMQPDDVITNVNGIAISDVGNVANVISSMLSGSRFDFRVDRDGEPVKLGYAVK